ncbi:hypothetical protein [Psychrobacter sp. DAB_AL32B]|uniref:hypothetical protein n=1 Tax=Psychrobacter sp. DAB_AL32B TaxID=1028414 RepID=UPI000B7FBF43|nr:hypothetical protein [Psychrobacter sp. DAB_AL32B]OXL28685.1 hypothetical protein CAN34_00495 [Psychrobacter sp. DAB_AL32B]
MNKGFWLTVGLLVLLAASLFGLRSLYKPAISAGAGTDSNTKVMMSLDKFSGFHHDAEILLEKLTVLKTGMESAIATQDSKLLTSTISNTYRIIDNVNVNRLPTIAPFEVCDEALNTLSLYTISAKANYSHTNKTNIDQVNELRDTFNIQFAQCQSIVNDKSVEALYQDYQ